MGTREDSRIQTKLKNLKKEFDRNETQMREAAIHYENLVAEKESLTSAMADLKKARAEARQ